MPQNDRITEIVSPKAQEQVVQLDANLRKILATYNELAKASKSIVSIGQGNEILKKRISLDQEAIDTSTKLARQKKAEADAEAARQRAIKAGITTQNALNREEKKSIGTRSTNLQQIRSLNSFYQQQSRLLNKLRDDYKSLEAKKQLGIKLTKQETVEYRRLSAQVRALDSALKKTDAAAGQFQRNVGNYAKGTRLLLSSFRQLAGAFGFTSGIYLFAAAISNSFKRVREFDKSMQNLAGVLRTTRDQIKDVESEIIRVAGASVKTSREVATLAESLATLGLRGQDLINLIKPANDLSIALGTTSDEAAEFLVQNLNAFGASSDEAAKYADVIATIRTSTSLDFQRMRDSFQYLTPISRILGEDLAYTGGIIGVLSDNSIKAEQGARLLGTAQQKLAKQGLSLTDALDQINEAQERGAEGLELLQIASDLFGKQAAKVGIVLANNRDNIEQYADRIRSSSGALDDLVNEQLKSLDAQIKILDSTWERLILTIENGEGKYARFFKGITLGLTGWLEELTEVEEAQSRVFDITGEEGNGFAQGFNKSLLLLTGGLVQLNTEYDELVEQQREFNRYYNTLSPNTSLGFLKDEIDSLSQSLRENNDLTDEQRKLIFGQIQRLEELYNTNKRTRNELEAQAFEIVKVSGHFEEFGNKIEVLTNEQLRDFINQNKGLLKTIQDINEEFENQEFTSLDSLNQKLKDLKVRYNSIDIESDEFQTIKKEIEELEAYIASITGKNKEKTIKILEGTVAAYQKEISELKTLRDTTARTTEEYEKFNDEIFKLERNIKTLTEGIDELNKVEDAIQRGIAATADAGEVSTGGFNPFGEITVPDYLNINQGLTNELIKQEEKKDAIIKSLREGELEDFKDFTDEETRILVDALDQQNKLREQAYQAAEDLVFGSIQAIFDARVQKVDEEIAANDDYYDAILERENLSKSEREKIERAKDAKDKQLREERAKREKEAFLVQQGIAVAQIAIDLAKTIAAINLTAAVLDSISFGSAGNVYRAANIPIAITTAALQTGLVLAQSIPQFFKGKESSDNYQGWATVNELPGQRELKIDKYGGVTTYKAGMQMDYIKSSDIIVPNMDTFNREVKDPSSDIFKRLSYRINAETAERSQSISFVNNMDTTGIENAVERAMMKYAKRPVHAKVKVEYPDNYSRY